GPRVGEADDGAVVEVQEDMGVHGWLFLRRPEREAPRHPQVGDQGPPLVQVPYEELPVPSQCLNPAAPETGHQLLGGSVAAGSPRMRDDRLLDHPAHQLGLEMTARGLDFGQFWQGALREGRPITVPLRCGYSPAPSACC